MSRSRKQEPKGIRQARTYAQLLGCTAWLLAAVLVLSGAARALPELLLLLGACWILLIATAFRGHRSTRTERFGAFLLMPVWPALLLIQAWTRRRAAQRAVLPAAALGSLDVLAGEDFEVQLQHLFRRLGYRADTTPRTGDFGADLLLTGPDGQTWAVQAKRYERPVGVQAVQEVLGAVAFYGTHRGMVVTNRTFTPAAREMAQRTGITLWDRSELARVMACQGPQAGRSGAGTFDAKRRKSPVVPGAQRLGVPLGAEEPSGPGVDSGPLTHSPMEPPGSPPLEP